MWQRRIRRLLVCVLVLAIVGTAAFAIVKPFRVAVQTLALVPELLNAGPQPLSALSPEPTRVSTTYGGSRPDRIDIYVPGGTRTGTRHPALVLVLGVNRVPLDDPRVVRFASSVARLGLVVAAPESTAMKSGRIGREEPSRLVEAFELVANRPEVDQTRVGIAGFSVGGSIALIAAADARIADRVAYVNAFGAYASASRLLVDIATHTVLAGGESRPWEPGEMTKRVFLTLLVGLVAQAPTAEELSRRLAPFILDPKSTPAPYDAAFAARLPPDALAVYRLATARDRGAAEAAIAALPVSTRQLLAAISPTTFADELRAPVFLMHDEADDAIPFAHLEPLAAAVPPPHLRRTTSFRLFDHVEPGTGIGVTELPEIWKLFWHLQDVLNQGL